MKSEKWRSKLVLKFTQQIMQGKATPIDGLLVALDMVRQYSRLTMASSSYDRFTKGLNDLLNQVAESENLGNDLDSFIDPSSPEFDAAFAKEVIELRPDWFSQREIDAVNAATRDE